MHKMRCASKNNFHTLLKIKSATDALIIICRNFSAQKFLKTATADNFDSYFNGRLITYTWNGDGTWIGPIFTRLSFLHISIWILRTIMYPSGKTRPGSSQATKINVFARIV